MIIDRPDGLRGARVSAQHWDTSLQDSACAQMLSSLRVQTRQDGSRNPVLLSSGPSIWVLWSLCQPSSQPQSHCKSSTWGDQ